MFESEGIGTLNYHTNQHTNTNQLILHSDHTNHQIVLRESQSEKTKNVDRAIENSHYSTKRETTNHGKRKREKIKRASSKKNWTETGKTHTLENDQNITDNLNNRKQFKEPGKKPNHNERFYDIKTMPMKKLFGLFEKQWTMPDKFEPSRFKIEVTEDDAAPWTEEHGWDAEMDTDMWHHFGHLRFEHSTTFMILGTLTMWGHGRVVRKSQRLVEIMDSEE